jgi:Na+/alanine symporter
MGLILRWVFAFLLVALTYNPTQWNYVRWSLANSTEQLPLVVLFGLLLLVGYVIYLRATLRSIGAFGMVLVLAVFGALVWVLYDYGLLSLENSGALVWLGIIALSSVLGIGLSWSFIRRALSGQLDVDDADN